MSQENDNASQQLPQKEEDTNLKEVVKKKREKTFNVARRRKLLKVMKETGSRRTACAAVGISTKTLENELSRNQDLYKRFKNAEAEYLAELEAEAKRRAVDGVDEGVYYKGELIGTEKKYSDDLLKTLLKAQDKEKYGNKTTVENNHNINSKDNELRNKLATHLGIKLEEAPRAIEEDVIDGEYTEEED